MKCYQLRLFTQFDDLLGGFNILQPLRNTTISHLQISFYAKILSDPVIIVGFLYRKTCPRQQSGSEDNSPVEVGLKGNETPPLPRLITGFMSYC
jgi:hypothetical protein